MNLAGQHPIRLTILEQLRVSREGLRYSRMRPSDIESDLYNYHLKRLVTQGLVQKRGQLYYLTDEGIKLIMELNPVTLQGESHRFKMASLCLVTRMAGGRTEALVQERTRRPFAGQVGLIGGGIMRGELATKAAKRRLSEEAGLTAEFELIGLVRKRHFDLSGRIYSDILFHVCAASAPDGSLQETSPFGRQSWIPLTEAVEIETSTPGGSPKLGQQLSRLADGHDLPLFYVEEDYHRDPE